MPRRASLIVLVACVSLPTFAEERNLHVTSALTSEQARALELTASTADDHSKLAAYYEGQLRDFAAKAKYHQAMAKAHPVSSLAFESKAAVSMQRHCGQWAQRFISMAEHAAYLSALHQEKAIGRTTEPTTLALLAHSAVLRVRSEDAMVQKISPASLDQGVLFRRVIANSGRLYEQSKLLTYLVDAKGRLPVAATELQESARQMFVAQEQFLASLSQPQLLGLREHILRARALRQRIETVLTALGRQMARPDDRTQFKEAQKLKQAIELWQVEEQEVGRELTISGSTS